MPKPVIKWDYAKIEALASRGLTMDQVCHNLGINRRTFYVHRQKDPALEEAYERGKAKGIAQVANVLYEKAIAGDNYCIMLFLKCRGGWSENTSVSVTNNTPIQINIKNDLKD